MHVYWGMQSMSELRYMTVATFKKHNPDWKIKFHIPTIPGPPPTWDSYENKDTYNGTDFTNRVLDDKDIEVVTHDLDPRINDVHRSDLLRWELLSTEGGLWSDIDVLHIRPVDKLVFNTPDNEMISTVLTGWGRIFQHRIGFLMASENNELFGKVEKISKKTFDPRAYQAAGSLILNDMKIEYDEEVVNIDRMITSAYIVEQVFDYSGYMLPIPRQAVCQHWYGGHPLAQTYVNSGMKTKCYISKILETT